MVISFCNEKGGCGKSTLSILLSARLAEDGDEVLLIDADPQKSVNVFMEARNSNGLSPLFSSISKLGNTLKDEIRLMRNKFDCLIIDTGGRDTVEMRQSFLSSDVVIIPVIPSTLDESIMKYMIDIFQKSRDYNENLVGLILPSKITTNPFVQTKELQDFKGVFEETKKESGVENLFLMESYIADRKAYKDTIRMGKSLKEFGGVETAKQEFEKFFQELVKFALKK
ncbi:chromosome partitioning protein ParA [Helicobacter pullorum]|uniref:AAA family ATPase n=1 Tax=Helicobacter pullorum TaxID=35818 RepID=UPI000816A992|nr:AAA family ATPase [Helicobacter pullorum]OCR19354.1 chromosome partitioning protein ParA [Helicobacter pullorum]